ncbi:MAG: CFI-box-CTERM domain-containing protein [Gammaproteobacteria bacterium]
MCGALFLMMAGPVLGDGTVQFADTRITLDEGETGYITVVRSGGSTDAVTVLLNVNVGGTARLDTDFEIILPLGVIQIPDGGLFAHVEVRSLNDSGTDGSLFTGLALSSPAGATLGAADNLFLDLLDDETGATTIAYTGDEVLRVDEGKELAVGFVLSDATVGAQSDASGQPGSATLGVDYTDFTQTVLFDIGETERSASLFTLEDDLFEGTETLTLVMANGEPDGVVIGDTSRLVLIEDAAPGQPGELNLSAIGDTTVPVDIGTVEFRVTRDRGNTGPINVDYVTADGSGDNPAVADRDYTAETGTLAFADGETTKTFEIEILDSGESGNSNRRFSVYIVNPTDNSSLDPDQSAVEIVVERDSGGSGNNCIGFCDCFIATAAYGSWMHPHVASLRLFRDEVLLQTSLGTMIVETYYRYSPPIAMYISQRPSLRSLTRAALAPLVVAIERPLGSLLFLVALLAGVRLRRRLLSASQERIGSRSLPGQGR